MEHNELKPCKCGGQAGIFSISVPSDDNCLLYYVQCDECDNRTDYSQNKNEAINAWNRRANDEMDKTTTMGR